MQSKLEAYEYPERKAIEGTRLENYTLFLKYGFFYYPYTKNCYYYEIVYMLKRFIYLTYNSFIIPLLVINTKFSVNLTAFINLEIIFIWGFFLFHLYKKPFREELKIVNRLETLSSITVLTSFFLSALFFNNVNPGESSDKNLYIINYILYTLSYVAKVLFFIYAFRIIYFNEKYNFRIIQSNFVKCLKFPLINIKYLSMSIRKFIRCLR